MTASTYRYTIDPSVPIAEAEITLLLSVIAVESLHGQSQARLDAVHSLDAGTRSVTIDATTDVGRDLNKLFAGYLAAEFGADSFKVQRVERAQQSKHQPEVVTA